MRFIDTIYEKAKANLQTIAIPEYDNDYMLKAAVRAHQDRLANILLVGPTEKIREKAAELLEAIRHLQKCTEYAQGNVSPAAICGYLQWALR